jgi:hypothetical protein
MRPSMQRSYSQGYGAIQALSNNEIMRIAPSVFAEEAHSSRSDKYAYIPTSEILVALRKEGFEPYTAQQSGSRTEGKAEFTKHMLRFRHRSQLVAAQIGAEVNEVVLVNSHDGTSRVCLFAGMYRFVCCNGLMVGNSIQEVAFPHQALTLDNVIEGSYRVLDELNGISYLKEEAKLIELPRSEYRNLGTQALQLKFDLNDYRPSVEAILQPRRHEDAPHTLWNTFNVLQENIMRGGVPKTVNPPSNRLGTTRETTNINDSVKLNRGLWNLLEGIYVEKMGVEELL